MYDREIDGKEYHFGVSGKLIRNVLVMYDRETGTLWSQLLGEAVEGDLEGTELAFLPSWMMTWEEWQELHPDSIALDKGGRGSRDPYERGYYESGSTGVIPETFRDDRLYVKEFIIGVALEDDSAAYPFSILNEQPIVNDEVSGTPLVVVFDKDGASGAVYSREVNGRVLTFEPGDGPFRLVDQETGTIWDGVSGEALEGTLIGSDLEPIKHTTSFWFGWKDFYPKTKLYEG